MITKAVVLAAGKGNRLRPITDKIPKVMVPINDKPVLEYHIESLVKNGICEIYINLHYLPDVIKDYFADGSRWGARINYSFESEILGTAGAVKKMEKYLFEDSFIVVYGDNYLTLDYSEFITDFESKRGIASIGVFEKDDIRGSGVVEMQKDGRIVRFLEKPNPAEELSHWINAGVYCFQKEIFRYLEEGPHDFGFNVFPSLLRNGEKVYAFQLKERAWAIDSIELLEELNKAIIQKGNHDNH